MGRVVLLRHDTPPASSGEADAQNAWHYDLLLEPDQPHEAPLIALRIWVRVDLIDAASIASERLPPHRREYLTYEGELSGNRGRVSRLAEGTCRVLVDTTEALVAHIDLGHFPTRLLRGSPLDEARWRLDVGGILLDPRP
jgi:hypothetical protein